MNVRRWIFAMMNFPNRGTDDRYLNDEVVMPADGVFAARCSDRDSGKSRW
jgi:hypothetical protein